MGNEWRVAEARVTTYSHAGNVQRPRLQARMALLAGAGVVPVVPPSGAAPLKLSHAFWRKAG